MRRNSTISVTKSSKNTNKRLGSYQAASIKTKVEKQFTFHARQHLGPNTRTRSTRLTNTSSSPRRDYVVDVEGAQKNNLKFQTLNGCVVCFDKIPKEYIKKVIHIRDRADTEARIRGSVAHIPSKGKSVTTSWRQTRSTSYAKVIGEDSVLEKLYARHQKKNRQPRTQMPCRLVRSSSKSARHPATHPPVVR